MTLYFTHNMVMIVFSIRFGIFPENNSREIRGAESLHENVDAVGGWIKRPTADQLLRNRKVRVRSCAISYCGVEQNWRAVPPPRASLPEISDLAWQASDNLLRRSLDTRNAWKSLLLGSWAWSNDLGAFQTQIWDFWQTRGVVLQFCYTPQYEWL